MKLTRACGIGVIFLGFCSPRLFAQAEVSGWGNLRGIRVSDQLMKFTTAVGVFNSDFSQAVLSQREGPIRTNQYVRDGASVTVGETLQYPPNRQGGPPPATPAQTVPAGAATRPATNPAARRNGGNGGGNGGGNRPPANGFAYKMTYTDSAPGTTDVSIALTSTVAQTIGGVYYFVNVPAADFGEGSAEVVGGPSSEPTPLAAPDDQGRVFKQTCKGLRLTGKNHQRVEIDLPQPLEIVVRRRHDRDDTDTLQVFFPIVVGNTTAGQTATSNFTLKAAGDVETTPVTVTVDPSQTGRAWAGVGGNYRIQNQRLDPLHIQYIMDNMRVAYGRVALPWNVWQPQQDAPPPMTAGPATRPGGEGAGGGGGGAMNSITSAMEIAQKLSQKNIPMIISVWSPPSWAVLPNPGGQRGGGQRLDPAKYDDIAKSIGAYLIYLRDHYGTEPVLFSFNESNIGINVKQSPQDHDTAIKILGAYFKSIGLKTKMLLGDTGDALPVNFIQVALNDPEATPYIGAVSFHSWRGATDEQYQRWADAADRLGVPLIDAEGGNDAQAAGYSNIFREAWYSLDEAAEYVRIMRVCQPQAILEWQFTENYSVLTNDKAGQLAPTQRFFDLKQLNVTPAGAAWTAVQSSSPLVLPAALADKEKGSYTVHLVNNGATRRTTLSGLPDTVKRLHVYVTDADRGMKASPSVTVTNGSVTFTLDKQSLTTLTTLTTEAAP